MEDAMNLSAKAFGSSVEADSVHERPGAASAAATTYKVLLELVCSSARRQWIALLFQTCLVATEQNVKRKGCLKVTSLTWMQARSIERAVYERCCQSFQALTHAEDPLARLKDMRETSDSLSRFYVAEMARLVQLCQTHFADLHCALARCDKQNPFHDLKRAEFKRVRRAVLKTQSCSSWPSALSFFHLDASVKVAETLGEWKGWKRVFVARERAALTTLTRGHDSRVGSNSGADAVLEKNDFSKPNTLKPKDNAAEDASSHVDAYDSSDCGASTDSEAEAAAAAEDLVDSIYECGHCGSRKVVDMRIQKRGLDEGDTVVLKCRDCGKQSEANT